uniref:26S proteasome complex subunit SEM1 n=1 Tax=Corvus moneduloides TaxID=1196302 RepID=A0A8C3GZ99_CORMO
MQHTIFRLAFLSLDWTGLDEDEDAHVWEDNWDDDNVEDDFSNQLSMLQFSVCTLKQHRCSLSRWANFLEISGLY